MHQRSVRGGHAKLFIGAIITALAIWLLLAALRHASGGALATALIASPVQDKVVVIDAGHGGQDGGAIGPDSLRESSLNLQMAFALEEYLQACGFKTIMTRTDEDALGNQGNKFDKNADMAARKKVIQESGADLVISLHMNKFRSASANGAQVFFQKGSEHSEQIAKLMQQTIRDTLQPDNRRTHQAENFYVLRVGAMPGVLVECGFVSNPQEAALLSDDAYRRKLAWCIGSSVVKYYALLEAEETELTEDIGEMDR